MNLNPVAGIIEAVGSVVGDLVTTDKERMDAEIEMKRLGLEELRISQATDLAQIEVNKVEAASQDRFVSRGRPFIIWVCGVAFAYAALIEPIARFVAKVVYGYSGEFPAIDTDLTLQVLFGLLGLGALRTVEKWKGVAR